MKKSIWAKRQQSQATNTPTSVSGLSTARCWQQKNS